MLMSMANAKGETQLYVWFRSRAIDDCVPAACRTRDDYVILFPNRPLRLRNATGFSETLT